MLCVIGGCHICQPGVINACLGWVPNNQNQARPACMAFVGRKKMLECWKDVKYYCKRCIKNK